MQNVIRGAVWEFNTLDFMISVLFSIFHRVHLSARMCQSLTTKPSKLYEEVPVSISIPYNFICNPGLGPKAGQQK